MNPKGKKRIGVILCGAGHRDGSEIHESVIAMLSLLEEGAELQCLSLNKSQVNVIDHLTGSPSHEKRNMLTESARIARGKIVDIASKTADVWASELDGLVLPGGFGSAFNLCTYAQKGEHMTVDDSVENLLKAMYVNKKPIGAICIAPVILSKVFGEYHPKITIGTDPSTAEKVEKMGAAHVNCQPDDCVVDAIHKLVSTPAYMLAENCSEFYPGIKKLARHVLKMA